MKPLSEKELTKCAEEAWQKTSFMVISHDAFIVAYKQGYAKCIWQMSDKFNELISVFETLLCRTNERRTTMNYYIQGDPSRAQEIKAAFEKLGYEKVNVIHIGDYANERLFFFTENGKVRSILKDCGIVHIIKTHPDYQELELPVEHILKVGDWIVPKSYNGEMPRQIVRKLDTVFVLDDGTAYICKDAQKSYRLWTVEDANDGDIICFNDCTRNNGNYIDWVGIYRRGDVDDFNHYIFHCTMTSCRSLRIGGSWRVFTAYPATKEQRDLLFAKIKESGYQWDEKKKELKKITKHYDIANFKPKQWVLVRDDDEWEWALTRFSYLSNGSASLFVCINGASFQQCIPYNEDTKHLLGTTDMPSEEFINW